MGLMNLDYSGNNSRLRSLAEYSVIYCQPLGTCRPFIVVQQRSMEPATHYTNFYLRVALKACIDNSRATLHKKNQPPPSHMVDCRDAFRKRYLTKKHNFIT